ncbi:MAG: F0F1 ATP synthase subunit B [Erysipelotrichaceae bacterium]|nr:F0F1 ATP synthase subunit B [Erysipelotrichaceae bacterium]
MINVENYLRLDLTDVLMVLVSTILIIVIARKFFWNYAEDFFKKRQDFIASQLNEAKEKEAAGAAYKEEMEEKLKHVHEEADQIRSTVESNARKEASEIVAKANEDAEAIRRKARADIERDRQRAEQQMKEEMSSIAILAASKMVGKELNDELHQQYIQDFIDEVGE